MTERVFDEIPIFMQRLVADSGGNITGGAAQVGSVGVASETRSCTTCRASSRSVPGLKIILIDDSWATDLERMTSRLGIPLRACSSGMVTRASTSPGESPRHG